MVVCNGGLLLLDGGLLLLDGGLLLLDGGLGLVQRSPHQLELLLVVPWSEYDLAGLIVGIFRVSAGHGWSRR